MTLRYSKSCSRRLALLAAGFVALLAREGSADPEPSAWLGWEAPASCPQQAEVVARVKEVAGPAYSGAAALHAHGVIRSAAKRYTLELRVSDGNDTQVRRMDAKSCTDLAAATAVILGLKLQQAAPAGSATPPPDPEPPPSASASGSTRAPDTEAAPDPAEANTPDPRQETEEPRTAEGSRTAPSEPADPVDPIEPPEARGPRSNFFVVSLPTAFLAVDGLASPAVLLGGALGGRFGNWGFSLGARYEFVRTVAGEYPGTAARLQRHSAELLVFRAFRLGAWEIAPALSGGALVVSARGSGRDVTPSSARAVVGYGAANVALRCFVTDWFALTGTVSGQIFANRPGLEVESLGQVNRFGPGQIVVGLGSEWNL